MTKKTEDLAAKISLNNPGARASEHPGAVGPHEISDRAADAADDDVVGRLLRGELLAIKSAVANANVEQCIASLTERAIAAELVRQQYTGRYPVELLQNASDAAARFRTTKPRPAISVRFVVTNTALVVANMGESFRTEQVEAICGLGRTSKDPRETIGYKGLGFKSVGEITDTPQILSGGYRFTFDGRRAHREVEQHLGSKHPRLRVPSYAFPFPIDINDLGEDRELVEECQRQGYVTVLRLPLKDGVNRGQVAQDLAATLSPRTLLLLDCVDILIVEGTDRPFSVERDAGEKKSPIPVVLQINDATLEDWLLFDRQCDIPSRDLVSSLGEGWAKVTKIHVTVAVRNVAGKPDASDVHPLHVYFSTEDTCGFAFLVHADFALTMDRRHVSLTREAKPYNEWVAKELIKLLTEDVVDALGRDYGSDPSVVAVLAPTEASSSQFARRIREQYIAALRGCTFIPTVSGKRIAPAEARLLPASVGDPTIARNYLDLATIDTIVTPEVQGLARARRLLHTDLNVQALTAELTLTLLRSDQPHPGLFYNWLVRWANEIEIGLEQFAELLHDVACVRTTDRTWVAPSKDVYFPRERGMAALPSHLPLRIADVPETARLVLQAAGVSHFRWREVVISSILPLLKDPQCPPEHRESAHRALRAYLESEGGNDSEITARVGEALIPARRASGGDISLRRADAIYFSSTWLGHENLEKIYGPFKEPEFIASPPPGPSDERGALRRYFEWLGVAARPRVDRQSIQNLKLHSPSHPSHLFRRWLVVSEEALGCPYGHPQSLRSGQPNALDRFEQIVSTGDVDRLRCLLGELTRGWPYYADALETVVRCQNKQHRGAQERRTPSLLQFGLRELSWIPAARGKSTDLYAPKEIWISSGDIPKRVLGLLPVLDRTIARDAELLGRQLGMVDGARASARQLVDALRLLAEESHRVGAGITEEVVAGARWIMRRLNDAPDDMLAQLGAEPPQLLAKKGGLYAFVVRPFFADDPLVADLWRDEVPILEADRELKKVHRAFDLRDLKKDAKILAKPSCPNPAKSNELKATLKRAAPYLAALAVDATPSQADAMRGRLGRIEIEACDLLTVECSLDGVKRFECAVTTYVSERREGTKVLATIHVDVSRDPDFYSIGWQLADFLDTPSQRDAFALILKGDKPEREAYLAARRIPLQRVHEEAEGLSTASDVSMTIFDDLLILPPPSERPTPAAPPVSAPHGDPTVSSDQAQEEQEQRGSRAKLAPPIEPQKILGYNVESGTATAPRRSNGAPIPRDAGQNHPRDWEQDYAERREIGKRGEQAAYEYARRQARDAGLPESVVIWQSQIDEMSPYDLQSVDADGVVFYIEVKSTSGSDEGAEFDISSEELRWALSHRETYKIYRVVDAYSAQPRVYCYDNIIDRFEGGDVHLALGTARMRLPRYASSGPKVDGSGESPGP